MIKSRKDKNICTTNKQTKDPTLLVYQFQMATGFG